MLRNYQEMDFNGINTGNYWLTTTSKPFLNKYYQYDVI